MIRSILFTLWLCFGLSISTFAQTKEPLLQTTIQSGHNGPVKSIRYSPNGKYIASGSRDKSVRLWEVATGREVKVLGAHRYTVRDLSFSPDGHYIATGGDDKRLLIWDIASGTLVKELEGHRSKITALAFSPDGKYLLSAGYDSQAYLWSMDSLALLQAFKVASARGTGEGVSVSFSGDGRYFAAGQDNYTAEVWALDSLKKIGSYRVEDRGSCGGCPTQVLFGERSDKLYTAAHDKGFYLWDIATQKIAKTYEAPGEDREYWFLDRSKNKGLLLTGDDRHIKLYGESSGKVLKTISSDSITWTKATFSPDGEQIAVGTDEGTVQLYATDTGKKTGFLQGLVQNEADNGYEYDVNSYWDHFLAEYFKLKSKFTLSPDGRYLLVGKIGKKARMITLSTGRVVREFIGHKKAVICYDFSPDGKWLLTGSADRQVILWDVASGKAVRTFRGHGGMVFDVKFDTKGKRFLSGSWDGTARLWDIASGKQLKYFDLPKASPYALDFVLDDLYFLVSTLDDKLQLYELDTRTVAKTYQGHVDKVHSLALHPDGQTFLSAGWDGSIRQWDLRDGLMDFKLAAADTDTAEGKTLGHRDRSYAVVYSPDAALMASGSADRTIKLWDTGSQGLLATLSGHKSAVTTLAFTPDGRYLLSASVDGEIKTWNLQDYREIMTYYTIGEDDWLAFTPDGFFDATPEARKYIFFIQGLDTYSIDQFFEDFYHPDLMLDLLAGKTMLKGDRSLQDKLAEFPPPTIEILSPKVGDRKKEGTLDFLVRFRDQGGGIDEIKVLHNGKRLPIEQKGLDRKVKKGNTLIRSFKADLVSGRNDFSISAYSKGRIESRAMHLSFPVPGVPRKGKAYVLAIGINKYQNSRLNLNYAKSDAQAFTKLFKNKAKALFEEIKVTELYNEKASKKGIFEALDRIALSADPEDLFLFYYAGHGSMTGQEFYFIPHEVTRLYEEKALKKEALHTLDMLETFKNIKALKQVVMIDACQSGGSVQLLAQRGGVEEKAIAQLSRSAGVHVMASAGSQQFATEFKVLGHGVFTYALLRALEGQADGNPGDGRVTIFELKSFLDNEVPELSDRHKGEPQYPYTFSIGNDFPLVLPEKAK